MSKFQAFKHSFLYRSGVNSLPWSFSSACLRSNSICSESQKCDEGPKTRAKRTAISGVIPACPFSNSETVFRLTPSAVAASPTVQPRRSRYACRSISPGCSVSPTEDCFLRCVVGVFGSLIQRSEEVYSRIGALVICNPLRYAPQSAITLRVTLRSGFSWLPLCIGVPLSAAALSVRRLRVTDGRRNSTNSVQ